ncbi:hypothetical protein ACPCG0_10160 [Propionibacteriaceae bacterium Y1923]|uniref:hypothetical protein n=1 Tax=Aestuariimicrobium sp. Y1814 TaxID=3418742 RepID=UPI003C2344B4
MIIWAGWGILGILIPGLAAGVMVWLGEALGATNDETGLFAGLGLFAGAVGAFLLGNWLNKTRVPQEAARRLEPRRQQLDQMVAANQFQLAPGAPMPSSYEEARAQSDYLFQAELEAAEKQLRNRHTLFWIPMQWVSAALGVLGLFIAISQLF